MFPCFAHLMGTFSGLFSLTCTLWLSVHKKPQSTTYALTIYTRLEQKSPYSQGDEIMGNNK